MTTTPNPFTPKERELVQTTLYERYGRVVPIHDVEVELQVDLSSPLPVTCAAFYWQGGDAEFVVARILREVNGIPTYRTQFFYDSNEVFGTGFPEYGNLGDCVISVLQVQATHEAERKAPKKGPVAPQPDISKEDDYTGPLVI